MFSPRSFLIFVQDLLSCFSLVIFLNNYINVSSSVLHLEQSNFIIDDQDFGAHLIHTHHRIGLCYLIFSYTFLACLALPIGHPKLDRLHILPLFLFPTFSPAFVYFLSYCSRCHSQQLHQWIILFSTPWTTQLSR